MAKAFLLFPGRPHSFFDLAFLGRGKATIGTPMGPYGEAPDVSGWPDRRGVLESLDSQVAKTAVPTKSGAREAIAGTGHRAYTGRRMGRL